jgi:CDP-diacylglycerol--glycerol-3-phosphate 3-phosphatidyltransferase
MVQETMGDPRERDIAQKPEAGTLTDWARARATRYLVPVARWLGRLGVHPDGITVVGFLLQVAVGLLFYLGRVRLGGGLLSVVAPLDALDGAVARANGEDGAFGAFLDSTLDRLSDAALILGLVAHHVQQGMLLEVALLLVALVAALMVSYSRARAEALGLPCKVGLLTRLERVLLIAALSVLGLTSLLAWSLAVLSVVTFLQRVVHVYHVCSRGSEG